MTDLIHKYASACALVLIAGAMTAGAQPGPRPPAVVSPEVTADRHVTFRIYAPKASSIEVTGDFAQQGLAKGGSLVKDERGVWSMTVGPLPADLYSYSFTVDGVRTLDSNNPAVKLGASGSSVENLFEVPGSEYAYAANTDVPHGDIRQVWYYSKALKAMRRMHVYTPPGYEQGSTKYPVFYLLHGAGDDDSGWSTSGRAGFIIDNLIASGKAKPMVVVMPNGTVNLPNAQVGRERPTPDRPEMYNAMNLTHDTFIDDLLNTIMPLVENRYRVLADQPNRAVAGLSMGGAQTLRMAPRNIDKFAYIGVFSMGWHDHINPDLETRNERFFGNPAETNRIVKLFWIGCGKDDTIIGDGERKLDALFTRRGIKHEFHESAGGHTYINWRAYLRDFAPKLFR